MSAKLGELLVREGLISPDELEAALEYQKEHGGKIGECLVRLGTVTEHYILATLATKYRLPIVDLARVDIDEWAAHRLPERFARRNLCIPISIAKRKLRVAMADPVDLSIIDELRFITGCEVEAALATADNIIKAIDRVYLPTSSSVDRDVVHALVEMDEWKLEFSETMRRSGEDTPPSPVPYPVRFLSLVLKNAIRQGASDIHFEPYSVRFRIRFRVDGVLKTVFERPYWFRSRWVNSIFARLRRLSGIAAFPAFYEDGEIRVTLETPALQRRITFEVSCLQILFGEKIVLRPCEEDLLATPEKSMESKLSTTDLFPGWSGERKERALIAAAQRGQIKKLRALLSSGAQVDAPSQSLAPLMAAAQKGQTKIVQELLAHGADATKADSGTTACVVAAFNGYTEMVRAFLDNGKVDLTHCIEQVLARTAMEANAEMIQLLVERHVVDAESALLAACEHGRSEIIPWLLQQGRFDIKRAVVLAARSGQAETLRILLEKRGDDVSPACLDTAVESLMEGWKRLPWLSSQTVRALAASGRLDHTVGPRIKESYVATLKLLLKAGADIQCLNPAHVASLAWRRGGRILRILFESGLELPSEIHSEMLLFAIQTAEAETASALIDAGTPIGAETLRWMMGDDRRKVLRLVQKRNAVRWKEDEKDRALMWAEYYGHTGVADMLREAGAVLPEDSPTIPD